MPAFSYEALNLQGQLCKGVIEADTARSARSLLRTQTLIPLRVDSVARGSGTGLNRAIFVSRTFNANALAVWTRQLAGLVNAGLPIERALTALTEEAEDLRQRDLVAALRADVNAGSSFAAALALRSRDFPAIYVSVVNAGEASGQLGPVLQRLADDLEEARNLRAKLLGAALYPAIVTLVALVIVVFLVSYVVPQVASVFIGSQRALPFLTVALLGLSGFVQTWGLALLGALAMALLAVRLALIGRLARHYNAVRFASTLAMLVGAGVPILKALQAAAETLSNQAMRADALDALALVREGSPLGSAIAQKKTVSRFAQHVRAAG